MGTTFSVGLLCACLPASNARAEIICALGSGASSHDANLDQRSTSDAMQLAKIVYAPQFFAAVHDNYGDDAIIAILAHEYGHALNEIYPATWMKSGWTSELRAGAWAGCALASSDLPSKALAEALTAVSKYPPAVHPPAWAQRLPAPRLGYVHCGGDASKFDAGARSKSK